MGLCGSAVDTPIPTISGLVHLANKGDVTFTGSTFAGSKGEGRQMEAFSLQINPPVENLGIEYMGHAANIGDLPWVSNGALCGTKGESRQIEGIAVRLSGSAASQYVVCYTAHLAERGDTPVSENGAYCGTKGESRQIEGIHVYIRRA